MRAALVLLGLLVPAGTAHADPAARKPLIAVPHHGAKRDVAKVATSALTLYLNNCAAGCNVKVGPQDAGTDTSDLAMQPATIAEHAWQPGEWDAIVQCVKEVYSPYAVKIVDQRPTDEVFSEVIVGGSYDAIGAQPSCGIGLVEFGCNATFNAVAFTFTEGGCYEQFKQSDPDLGAATAVWGTCAVIAQESAHSLGLDHELKYADTGASACNDPMSYREDCGGEKFFRNDAAICGESSHQIHECSDCGDTQNSHTRLLAAVGPGTPITKPPVTTLTMPADGAVIAGGSTVIGMSGAQRGVATIELWMNGYKWASVPGVGFGPSGQPTASYVLTVPANLPDSKYDLVLKAFDDIGMEGDSAMISVVKGKASGCDPSVMNSDGTIDTCLEGQQCTAGKCAWTDAGTGQFGDACTYDQFCTTNLECTGSATDTICTHDCDLTIADSCPMGYQCIASGTSGVCFFPEKGGGGCCSADPGLGGPGCLAFVTFVAIGRRRRKIR